MYAIIVLCTPICIKDVPKVTRFRFGNKKTLRESSNSNYEGDKFYM